MAAVVERGIPASHLSPGWTHPYASTLKIHGTSFVVLTGANGATTTFQRLADGSYTAPARVKAKLIVDTAGNYVVTYPNQIKDIYTVTDPANRKLVYTYVDGRISTIKDPMGRVVTYRAGRHVEVVDVGGRSTLYEYDSQRRMVRMRTPRGHWTHNVYDADSRVVQQTDPKNRVTEFTYAEGSTTVTEPGESVTRYELTGGLPMKIVRGVGTADESTVTMTRNASGNVLTRRDPDGQLSKFEYDSAGNTTKVTDPLERVTTMTYTLRNDIESVTDADATTTFAYDANGNLETTSRPLVGSGQTATTTNRYDPDLPGDLRSVTDPTARSGSSRTTGSATRTARPIRSATRRRPRTTRSAGPPARSAHGATWQRRRASTAPRWRTTTTVR